MITLALYPVEDRAPTGSCGPRRDGEVLGFLEKPDPEQIDTDHQRRRLVVESSVARADPGRARRSRSSARSSRAWSARGLFGRRLEGYWMDIGTSGALPAGLWDILEGAVRTDLPRRSEGRTSARRRGADEDDDRAAGRGSRRIAGRAGGARSPSRAARRLPGSAPKP